MEVGLTGREIGEFPNDWRLVSLREACIKIQDGTHFSPTIRGNDYYYVTSKNIRPGKIDLSTASRIDSVQHKSIYKRCDVRKGDLLLTKDGANTGNAAINPLEEEFSLLSSVALLRFNLVEFDAGYFLQQIASNFGQRQIQEAMSGNAITRLTLAKINKLSFPSPSHKIEQEAITEALSDADAWIESLEKLIAKKRLIKQGLMQELLTGKRRLPGFSGNWQKKRLGEIADVKTGPFGSSLHERDYVDIGTPIITVEHLGESGVIHQNLPLVSERDLHRLNSYSLQLNDIVFSRVGSIDRNAIIRESEVGWLFSGRLLRVRLDKSKTFAAYISHQFHSEPFRQKVRDVAVGQTMPCLNTKIMNGLAVDLPQYTEQLAIAEVLSNTDSEIATLETKLDKARQIKQGMMQNLLTGKIRLV